MRREVPAVSSMWPRAAVVSLGLTALVLCLGAREAGAQFLAPALDRAGFDSRVRSPSIRLASLGGVQLAFEDENNEIDLWDFGRTTTGLLSDRDSTSLDIWLDGMSRKDEHTVETNTFETDRKGTLNTGLLGVGRNPGKFAAGLDLGFVTFDSGIPAQEDVYEDADIELPLLVPTAGGTAFSGKGLWGARLLFAKESVERNLRVMQAENGDRKLTDGDVVPYPTFFDVNKWSTSVWGLGFALGWDQKSLGQISLQYDFVSQHVLGSQNTSRRIYETDEVRPINEYSVTAIVSPASLSWLLAGLTAGRQSVVSTEEYRFSLSGGTGAIPLASRGNRLERNTRQDFFRSRVQITPGEEKNLLVGGDFNVRYDRDHNEPTTGANDYNAFLDQIAADTLNLPQKVLSEVQELRHWDAGIGASYRFTDRLQAGIEGRRYNNARDGLSVHERQRITDLRGGVEYKWTPTWTARGGAYHRSDDADVYTQNNEQVTNALTLGAGYAPPAARYGIDGGLELAARSTDYPDPSGGEGSGLRFMLYGRWLF